MVKYINQNCFKVGDPVVSVERPFFSFYQLILQAMSQIYAKNIFMKLFLSSWQKALKFVSNKLELMSMAKKRSLLQGSSNQDKIIIYLCFCGY